MAKRFNGLPSDVVRPNPTRLIRTVTIEVTAEPEDIPIKGNAMASGDQKVDREQEQWIRRQLAAGNQWAWCQVTVRASLSGFDGVEGTATLGGCSYLSGADFCRPGGYFSDMVTESIGELMVTLDERVRGK